MRNYYVNNQNKLELSAIKIKWLTDDLEKKPSI